MGEGQEKRIAWITLQAIMCVMALLMLMATNLCTQRSIAQAATLTRRSSGTLTSAPGAGPTQATLVVRGSGWQRVSDGTVINFGFSTDPSCTAASYTPVMTGQAGVMNGGAFSGWFLWPARTPVDTYTVCASIGSTLAVAGSYTVLSAAPPQLTISSTTFNVGQQALISGSNFLPPQTSIMLTLQQLSGGTSVPLGTVTSDANGAFARTYTIPTNPTGPVELVATAGSGTPPTLSTSATFIVYVAPVTPTPTTVITPAASPSPAPASTATPKSRKTATPTSIPPRQTQVLPTPKATPISLGTQPQAPTPTSSSRPTQQPVAKMPDTGSEQSGSTQSPAPVVGAIFVVLAAALIVLVWRRKGKKQIAQPAFHAAIPGAGSLNPVPNQWIAQPAQPSASWTPVWDGLPVQQAAPSLAGTQRNTNGKPGTGLPSATLMDNTDQLAKASARNGLPGNEAAAETPDELPAAAAVSPDSDLLQDPLLAAIMQQARSGLFVLPGKNT